MVWLPIRSPGARPGVAGQAWPLTGVMPEHQQMRKPCGPDASASATTSCHPARRPVNAARRFGSSPGAAASDRAELLIRPARVERQPRDLVRDRGRRHASTKEQAPRHAPCGPRRLLDGSVPEPAGHPCHKRYDCRQRPWNWNRPYRIWALPADQHRAEAGGLRNYEYNPVWGSWSIRAGSDGPNRRAAVTVTYLPAALGWFILAWMRRREYV